MLSLVLFSVRLLCFRLPGNINNVDGSGSETILAQTFQVCKARRRALSTANNPHRLAMEPAKQGARFQGNTNRSSLCAPCFDAKNTKEQHARVAFLSTNSYLHPRRRHSPKQKFRNYFKIYESFPLVGVFAASRRKFKYFTFGICPRGIVAAFRWRCHLCSAPKRARHRGQVGC